MIKKLFLFVLAISLVSGVALAADNALSKSPGAGDIMNQGRLANSPGRIFRVVRWQPLNSGSSLIQNSLTADSIVVWDTTSDDGVTITTTLTSGDAAVAGIVPIAILTPDVYGQTAAQDLGKRNWGWLQTYGLSEATIAATGAVTAGSKMGTGTTYGGASGTAAATDTTRSCGFFLDTAAVSATDVEVFLIND